LNLLLLHMCSETCLSRRCANSARPQDLKKKRKTIFQSAAKYVKEYQSVERNLIRMRRQARDNGNYFIEPSPKVVFVVRIRG
jgi:large subunit ribosomal protein L7e